MAMPPNIAEFITTVFPIFDPIPFENECTAQFQIHLLENLSTKFIDWIRTFKADTSHKSNTSSDNYREQGNRLFRANKTLNALQASLCYTNAILAAPDDGSKSLALAHANRSAALAEFGYFKEAYEDCQCAVDYGYPDENLQKIIVRQANCAAKLNDCDKLKMCLAKLGEMTLSPPFAKRKAELDEALIRFQDKEDTIAAWQSKADYKIQNVLTHSKNGRYMTASKDINKGEVILNERAFSLIPVEDAKICSSCAAQNIIPFPCNVCSKVFYCSIKCRKAEEMVHRFECYARRCGLLNAIGITHLAMNILLNGLPSIVPSLKECTSPMGIWEKIETIAKSGEKGYPEVLSLVTNFKLMQPNEVYSFSLGSAIMGCYLKEFTAFFTLFDGCACGSLEWSIIVSALIMRHTAQMLSNASSSHAIMILNSDVDGFSALLNYWDKPQHLKKGLLHKYSQITVNYAGIYPYLSICNHSCVPSLWTRFDGNRVIAVARQPFKQGDEISNTYIMDYRKYCCSKRREDLNMVYRFHCKCKNCSSANPDAEYLKFHEYRCQNSSCNATFSPPIDNVCWWLAEGEEKMMFLTCPVCRMKLNLDWYWRFEKTIECPGRIREALQIINFTRQILVGSSKLRQDMASIIVQMFFEARKRGLPEGRDEIKEIGELLNYRLKVIEHQYDVESLTYVQASVYALDLMAQYKSLDFDCKKIQNSFQILPDDLQIIFENYIKDFLGDRFSF